ncbi:hypothetical protein AX17_005365 [Amanita inopinata Kibby_2008]|nr:hypothetical protein AX17_005365 [Amanita inopinata Kibby_2008]
MSNNQTKEERLAAFREQRWAEMAREEAELAARIEEEERLERQRVEEARRAEEAQKAEEARRAKEARRHEEEEAAENEKAMVGHKRTVSDNAEAGPSQKRPKAPVVCTNCMKREQECMWQDSEWIKSCQWCAKNKQGCVKVGEGPKKAVGKRKAEEKRPAESTIEVREPLGRHTIIVDNGVFERLILDVRNLGEEVELLRELNQALGESIDWLAVVMKQRVSVAEGEPEYSSEEDKLQGAKERKAVEDKGVEQVAEVKRGPNDPLSEEVEKSGSENAEQEEESEGSEDS